jgi:hypothetical protein
MPFGKSHIEMAFNKTTQTLAVMMWATKQVVVTWVLKIHTKEMLWKILEALK